MIWSGRSQLIAAVGLVGGALASWTVQPYLDVFVRWNHVRTERGYEVMPNDRINRIAKSAFTKLKVPENISNRIDIFLTNNAEAVGLGSLGKADAEKFNDYAFIGLPYFCAYEDPSYIPIEGMKFASILFPYTAYSAYGNRRLELMHLSDAALEFLIAREVASLLGSRELAKLSSSNFNSSFLPPRLASRVASLSLLGSLYFAYQVCGALNHFLHLTAVCPTPLRFLGYTVVTALVVLCQRQLIISWRHNASMALDAAVAILDRELLVGGIEYYTWKREWNAFWAHLLPTCRKASKVVRKVARTALTENFSPLLRYQVQWCMKDPTLLYRNPADYYFIPPSIGQVDVASRQNAIRIDDCSLTNCLPGYEANSLQGDEKFASDGEVLRFNTAGLLAFGAFPAFLASVFQMLSYPATCGKRKAALEALL